jgi:hypothetical protein
MSTPVKWIRGPNQLGDFNGQLNLSIVVNVVVAFLTHAPPDLTSLHTAPTESTEALRRSLARPKASGGLPLSDPVAGH